MVNGTWASEFRTRFCPNPVDILRDHRIAHQLDLRFNLLSIRAAHGHLPLDAVPVAHAAAATHIAIPYRIHVSLGAIVLDLAVILRRQVGRGWRRERSARRPLSAGLCLCLEPELEFASVSGFDLGSFDPDSFDPDSASDRDSDQAAVFAPSSRAPR